MRTNYKLPQEIADLDAQIRQLQEKRSALYEVWLDSIAPFKRGDTVTFLKGRIEREGVIETMRLKYGGAFDYIVIAKLKKGGTERMTIYSWDAHKMEKVASRP
jgi:hypothetical protein